MVDLGVRPLHATWRQRMSDITTPLFGVLMVTCVLAGVAAVFAPVVGLIWLAAVAGLFAYAGVKAALDRH